MLQLLFFTVGNNLESHLESKHGTTTPYLQISDSISTSRALKQRIKKKKKGETRQCQTGMTKQAGISEKAVEAAFKCAHLSKSSSLLQL